LRDKVYSTKVKPRKFTTTACVRTTSNAQISHDNTPSSLVQPLLPRKLRGYHRILPLSIMTPGGLEPVDTCPDTGASANIIPESAARYFGYKTSDFKPSKCSFKLPGGSYADTIGELEIRLWFGTCNNPNATSYLTVFHVLPRAREVLIGGPFLDQTETMTKHTYRLIREKRLHPMSSSVRSVGRPRMQVLCEIDHTLTVALPDSGSDIDLISSQFALDRQLEINPVKQVIELADGTHIVSHGFVHTTVSIGTHFDSTHAPQSKVVATVDCFVLDDLSHDVILGEHSLDQLRVFTENQHSLVFVSDTNAAMELNRIYSPGKTLTWIKKKLNPTSTLANTNGQ
jgi:hypothetical protein